MLNSNYSEDVSVDDSENMISLKYSSQEMDSSVDMFMAEERMKKLSKFEAYTYEEEEAKANIKKKKRFKTVSPCD